MDMLDNARLVDIEKRLYRLEHALGLGTPSADELRRYKRAPFDGTNQDPHLEVSE